ncbi:hypothetical protein HY772_00580, partial [Candidatus Woesearchaeota archaeon]|nr:hypothetical protein [Candidatus Woesearchaeota archaeon]
MNTARTDRFTYAQHRFITLLLPTILLVYPLAVPAQICPLATPSVDSLFQDAFISTAALPAPDTVTYTDKNGQKHTSFAFPGQVVVLMDKRIQASAARALFKLHGAKVISQIPAAGFYVVQVGADKEGAFISAVNQDVRIKESFPNMSLP